MQETREFYISDRAAGKIARLIEAEGKADLFLRVTVNGGGCQGFEYQMDFDSTLQADDVVFQKNGISVVTDPASLDLLNNAEIDYVEELIGSSFKIKNPNAKSSCGCGTSFSI